MSSLHKTVLRPRGPPTLRRSLVPPVLDYTPVGWSTYFQTKTTVKISSGNFCVYRLKKGKEDGLMLVCLHGGGYSGLSWSLFAKEITGMMNCEVVAIDLRGHGETTSNDDNDLSVETLTSDVVQILEGLDIRNRGMVLMGHSMGGAIAVRVANIVEFTYTAVTLNFRGLIVIDVVEGSAMEALSTMQTFLRSRPQTFPTQAQAVAWSMRNGLVRRLEAARVSIPGQLKSIATNQPATLITECSKVVPSETFTVPRIGIRATMIREEETPHASTSPTAAAPATDESQKPVYTWRIDLSKTERYWMAWFQGLSQQFLDIRTPKLLLLAGIDRLDRELLVGQMQGKFQMQVLNHVGHTVHEDSPEGVAESVMNFCVRQKLIPPKPDVAAGRSGVV